MTGMQMDGGTASLSAVAAFLGMWIVMMVAMMLPSLAPTLWRYRRALRGVGGMRAIHLTLVLGTGYFLPWTLVGLPIYPVVVARARSTPMVIAISVIIAGVLQLSAWKARQLAHCRAMSKFDRAMPASSRAAWRAGLCLGRHCVLSCAPPMASLIAIGMTDVRVMAVVTIAITLERLAPAGVRDAPYSDPGAPVSNGRNSLSPSNSGQ